MIGALLFMGNEVVNSYMTHAGVQNLMNSNEKFDVCIIEIFQEDALVVRLIHSILHEDKILLYRVLPITYTTYGAVKWINERTGKCESQH